MSGYRLVRPWVSESEALWGIQLGWNLVKHSAADSVTVTARRSDSVRARWLELGSEIQSVHPWATWLVTVLVTVSETASDGQ